MISRDTSANVTAGASFPEDRAASSLAAPRTLSLALVGMYALGMGAVLAAGGGRAWLIVLHLCVVGVALWSANPAGAMQRVVGDLLPLLAAPLAYRELPQLIQALGSSYHDLPIQQLELTLFGNQPAHTFAGAVPNFWLSELLHAGYVSYYLALFVPPLILYWRGDRRAYAQTLLATTLTQLVCWTIFVIAPVEGPRYLWSAPPGIPDGPIRRLAVNILEAGSSRGAAFPSSHMAVSVSQALLALKWQPRVGAILCVVAVTVAFGAVYGGFHYATDMIAGAALGTILALAVVARARP